MGTLVSLLIAAFVILKWTGLIAYSWWWLGAFALFYVLWVIFVVFLAFGARRGY